MTRKSARLWRGLAIALVLAGCSPKQASTAPSVTPVEAVEAPSPERAQASAEPRTEAFSIESAKLGEFVGAPVQMHSIVLTPPGYDPEKGYPIVYVVHGFGGNHEALEQRFAPRVIAGWQAGTIEPMLWVFLDASHPFGHHVFADSANMGPWGTALVEELIPAVEARFGAVGKPEGRFTMGHSSGGWSSLWLQVSHPEVFGAVCSTAPDPVDFRAFTGVDLYAQDNMYRDAKGNPTQLMRRNGKWAVTFEEYARQEIEQRPVGGQIFSFDAVFSPRGDDGMPVPVFDRETGVIDKQVVEAWKPFDISLVLRRHWDRLGPQLAGKLHIIVGTQDTFGLEAAVYRLDEELDKLGSDADIVFVEGRTHGSLYDPHPELYPNGLTAHCASLFWETYRRASDR